MFDTHVSQDKLTTNVVISDGKLVILGLETQLISTVLASQARAPCLDPQHPWENLEPPVYNPSAGKVDTADPRGSLRGQPGPSPC